MKKLLLVLVIGFGLGTSAFAQHEGLGIGIVGGWGWGGGGFAGLSLKVPKLPIFWGLYPYFNFNDGGGHVKIGVSGDYYFLDKIIVGSGEMSLGWFLGLGGFLNLNFWNNGAGVNFGARLPIGLSWYIIKQLEFFLDFAPGIGFYGGTGGFNGPHWAGAFELGLRFWM